MSNLKPQVSFPFNFLHYSSVSWEITLLFFFTWKFEWFWAHQIPTFNCSGEIWPNLYFDSLLLLKVYNKFQLKMYKGVFLSICVFFHEHSRITGMQGKGEGISLTPHYYFHPRHRHVDIGRVITAESSPLHIASSWIRTGNFCFPSASR